ncbi:MAG TPA: M64 family metallopeptidase [Pyrinomonadaceae bacterium]|jgi:hypothetical protein
MKNIAAKNVLKIAFFLNLFLFFCVSSASAEPFETIINNGSPQNRIDIAIVGDGYTADQMTKYRTDVQTFFQGVFLQEPYKEYQRYYNVHRIDVVSNQSGADHPERTPAVSVNTAFDATYNCSNIQRLVCVSNTKVNQVIARSLPASHFDVILVLVNDPEYGGSGGSIAVASTHSSGVELILHEVGHSFGLLADEYSGGGPNCNPNVEPSAANSTRQTDRNSIKWNLWIEGTTSLPTFSTSLGLAGLFVGSSYCDAGMYRPTFDSKMRNLGRAFEQINVEQHIKRIYNFASPIDSSSPAETNITVNAAQSKTFSISALQPLTHNLEINWLIDGQAVAAGASYNLGNTPLSSGMHTIQAVVKDTTPFVRKDPSELLKAVRTWNVDVRAATTQNVFDFDGDGKTDLSIFRPAVGEWWFTRSSNGGNGAFQFGSSTDKPVPADYTGDGKTDIAFFRPSTGEWYISRSEDASFYSFPFGANGDIPAPADYDGDGRADPAVFRSSSATWFVSKSSGGTAIQQFGAVGDVPVVADYDGDRKADIAIYRPNQGQWWLLRSSAGAIAFQFGASTDKPAQGDYTGDGKADVAFFRPNSGEWFILRSENSSFYSFPFGTSGDIPAPGDYDGDGKNDAAVFRPSNSTWYIQRSSSGTQIQVFGQSGDVPLASSFVP